MISCAALSPGTRASSARARLASMGREHKAGRGHHALGIWHAKALALTALDLLASHLVACQTHGYNLITELHVYIGKKLHGLCRANNGGFQPGASRRADHPRLIEKRGSGAKFVPRNQCMLVTSHEFARSTIDAA